MESYCSFRFLQFAFCVACLGVAIHILVVYTAIGMVIAFTLVVVAVVFTFITFLDLWTLCIPRPMPWNVWTMVCTAAALSFFLCCGLLAACVDGTAWFIVFAILNGFTALLFLMELTWLLGLGSRSSKRKTVVKKFENIDNASQTKEKTPQRQQTPPPHQLEPVVEEVIVPERIEEPIPGRYKQRSWPKSDEVSMQYPSDGDSMSARSTRGTMATRERKPNVTSYGGTFHVSKDVVPMPGPCPCKEGSENECAETRTVSVSTRLVLKSPRTKCATQPCTPRTSPLETKRVIKSALPQESPLEYEVSSAGTQNPSLSYSCHQRCKDKKMGTPQVQTNEGYTSMSSFVQQKSEKVQVHARVRHTREIETHTEVSTSAQQARDFAGMSCYYPQTTSVATAVTTGMLRYYQCQRCGRCYGYYWPPGTNQGYTCPQPSITYPNCQPRQDSTPTRDCCPCPPNVRQGDIANRRAEPELTSSDSGDCNDDRICQSYPSCSPHTPSDRHSSAQSGICYNTTILDDDDVVRRKKHRRYKWMPSRSGRRECSIQ